LKNGGRKKLFLGKKGRDGQQAEILRGAPEVVAGTLDAQKVVSHRTEKKRETPRKKKTWTVDERTKRKGVFGVFGEGRKHNLCQLKMISKKIELVKATPGGGGESVPH